MSDCNISRESTGANMSSNNESFVSSSVVARHGLVAKVMASNSPGNDRDNHDENTSGSENSRGEAGAANPEEQATQGDQNNDVVSEEIMSEAEEDSALCFGPEESLDNNRAGTANTVDHVAPTGSFPFEQQGNPAEDIPQFNNVNLLAESMDREHYDLEEAVGELIQLLDVFDVDVLDEGNIVQLSDSVTAFSLGPSTRHEQANNANTSHSGANLSSRNDGMKDEKCDPTIREERGKRGPYKCPACGARKVETKDGVPIPHLCPELVEEVKVWARKQDGKMSAGRLRDLLREAQRRMKADEDAPADISSSRRASKDDPRPPGKYRCGKCGAFPKTGHICKYKKRSKPGDEAMDDDNDRKPAAKERPTDNSKANLQSVQTRNSTEGPPTKRAKVDDTSTKERIEAKDNAMAVPAEMSEPTEGEIESPVVEEVQAPAELPSVEAAMSDASLDTGNVSLSPNVALESQQEPPRNEASQQGIQRRVEEDDDIETVPDPKLPPF